MFLKQFEPNPYLLSDVIGRSLRTRLNCCNIFSTPEAVVMKRRSTSQDENWAKVPKLEPVIKSETEPKKTTNVANILREQDLDSM